MEYWFLIWGISILISHLVSEDLVGLEVLDGTHFLEAFLIDLARVSQHADAVVMALDPLLLELDDVLQGEVLHTFEECLVGVFAEAEFLHTVDVGPQHVGTGGAFGAQTADEGVLGVLEGGLRLGHLLDEFGDVA